MKRRNRDYGRKFRCLGLVLCMTAAMSACGSEKEAPESVEAGRTETDPADTENNGAADSGTSIADLATKEDTVTDDTSADAAFTFTAFVSDADRMMQEAIDQYNAEDHTNLDEPVKYNVLWLGFTHVTYNDLDFQMTDFDREYLEAVALNYEKTLESVTDHNLDVEVELHFIEDETPLTQWYGADWLYLAQNTVQPVIDQYMADYEADTVLTTVQTAGEENRSRNESKDGYGTNDVMLGLETSDLSSYIGYSTFDLGEPKDGTWPLEDPEIPSLYATSVAVHEWMHQLEALGSILNIEYPNTHAYMGPDEFPGYQKYVADENDYDLFEFYKLVLQGELPYDGDGVTKHVGMYPKMWPLVKRNMNQLGEFTIQAADGSGYLTGLEEDPKLTLSDDACVWNISYSGNEHFVLCPKEIPDQRIDLGNAWDSEGNTIGIYVFTGYFDAQTWYLKENSDGTCSIQTPYESGRLLTATKGAQATLCTDGADGVQDWIIEPVK